MKESRSTQHNAPGDTGEPHAHIPRFGAVEMCLIGTCDEKIHSLPPHCPDSFYAACRRCTLGALFTGSASAVCQAPGVQSESPIQSTTYFVTLQQWDIFLYDLHADTQPS